MANVIYKIKVDYKNKTVDKIVNKIKEITENTDDTAKKAALTIVGDFRKAVSSNYQDYLRNIRAFEHNVSPVTYSITDTKKGYVVHINSKDILYHEYGTGSRGLEKPHPKHSADGMRPYGSGINVIHNGMRQDGKTPYWYKLYRDFPGGTDYKHLENDLNDEPIRSTQYVWRHNGVITKGLPAGKFIYEACKEYQGDGLTDKKVLKQTLNQTIAGDLIKDINKKIKGTQG